MEEGLRLATLRLPTGRTSTGSPLQLGPSQRHWRLAAVLVPGWPTLPMAAWLLPSDMRGSPVVPPLRPAPSRGHTSTGSAREPRWDWVRTALGSPSGADGARQEGGLRSAILRRPRRDEDAQRLCAPLAPRWAKRGPAIALVPGTGALADVQRGAALDSAAYHLGQQDPSHGSTGHRCLGGTRGRGPDAWDDRSRVVLTLGSRSDGRPRAQTLGGAQRTWAQASHRGVVRHLSSSGPVHDSTQR
jgi:hypothetical protein